MDGSAGYLIKTNLLTGGEREREEGIFSTRNVQHRQRMLSLKWGSNQLPTPTTCSVWWGIFNIYRLKVNIFSLLSDTRPFSVGKKKSVFILSVGARWRWYQCHWECYCWLYETGHRVIWNSLNSKNISGWISENISTTENSWECFDESWSLG